MRRTFTADEKRLVGARQRWLCSSCASLLPASFEVDHTVPLHDGGRDDLRNATAMCPNCHAAKSQLERVARMSTAVPREALYAAREDAVVRVGGSEYYECALCRQRRPATCAAHVCLEIEAPGALRRAVRSSLARFEYAPRRGGGPPHSKLLPGV